MKLWLARHAQPLVAPGVCYGATDVFSDVQATKTAAHALARELPYGITLLSSPLKRCDQLAQLLLELRPDLVGRTDERLVEMNFGLWEGQRWDAIARDDLDGWVHAFCTWRCGGAESVQDVMIRVAAVWDETRAQGQSAVWITHSGVISAATLIANGHRQVQRADQWPTGAPACGQWRVLAL